MEREVSKFLTEDKSSLFYKYQQSSLEKQNIYVFSYFHRRDYFVIFVPRFFADAELNKQNLSLSLSLSLVFQIKNGKEKRHIRNCT